MRKINTPNYRGKNLLGISTDFLKNPALFSAKHFHLGDFYKINLPAYDLYMVTNPEILQHILVRQKKTL